MSSTKNIFRKSLKILLFATSGILLLLITLWIYLNSSAGKRMLREQVQSYLQKKLNTKVSIGDIDYDIPDWLKLKNIYIEDQKKDTLLYGEELCVKMNMMKLIKREVEINNISLLNVYANISRPITDTGFNYQFIVDAFADKNTNEKKEESSNLKITPGNLQFQKIRLNFNDEYGGTIMGVSIDSLMVNTKSFDAKKPSLKISEISGNSIRYNMVSKNPVAKLAKEEEPASDFFLDINKINLSKISISINDSVEGFATKNTINQLALSKLSLDVKNNSANIGDVEIDAVEILFAQSKITKKTTTEKKDSLENNFRVAVNTFKINNTTLKYNDYNNKPVKGFDPNHLDVSKINLAVANILLSPDTTAALLKQLTLKDKSGFSLDTAHADFIMTKNRIAVNNLYVKTPGSLLQRSLDLSYDNLDDLLNKPKNTLIAIVPGKSIIAFKDLYLLYPDLDKTLPKSSFAKESIELNGEIKGDLTRLYIPSFQLSGLTGSKIAAKGTLYNITIPKKLSYNLSIAEGRFYKKDLLKFTPKEKHADLKELPEIIQLKGNLKGTTNDLVADIGLSGKGFSFLGKIDLKNISTPSKLNYAVNTKNISVDRAMLIPYVPKDVLSNLYIPEKLNLSGKLGGNPNDIQSDLTLRSALGELGMKGYIKNVSNPENAKYDLDISLVNFALGKLIKQDTLLGKITGRVKAKGEGFDFKTMKSAIAADIKKFDFKKYSYNNIFIESALNNGSIESKGRVNDENVRMFYDLAADIKADYPIINAFIDIDTVRMKELGLVDDLFNLSAKISLTSKSFMPRKLDASMIIDKLIVTNSAGTHPFYATSLNASSSNGIDSIVLTGPFVELRAGGAFDYDQIAGAVEQHISRYIKIPGRTVTNDTYKQQDLSFAGFIQHDSVFNTLMPGLHYFDPIIFSGKFKKNTDNQELFFSAQTKHVSYSNNEIGNFSFHINTDEEKLSADILIDSIKNENIDFYKTSLNTEAANELLSFNIKTKDHKLKDWFGLSGLIDFDGESYTFSMRDKVLLNYEKWNTNSDNFIKYSPEGIYVHNFNLTSDTSKIYLNSEKDFADSPVLLEIDNFNLKNISTFIRADSNFSSGILDAKLLISELDKATPAFEGTADITDLKIKNYSIGDINAKAAMLNDDRISADINLVGYNNDIRTNIEYFPDDTEKELDAIVYINKLNMNSIEAFSDGNLKNSSGLIKGKVSITGKANEPVWNGYIAFDTAKFTVTQLGTPYRITNQKIKLKYPAISLNEFVIKDTMSHALRIDGSVTMNENEELDLDLDINTKEFILLSAKKTAGASFYGFAAADIGLSITGTSNAPYVEGDIDINDKTDIAIVLPDNGYTKEDANTIVRFVDRDTFLFADHLSGLILEEKSKNVVTTNFNYNVNLEINKNAALRIIVDPSTGDEMLVQGDARLNAGVDPGGSIFLTGTYELEKGYYIQNYQFLKKQFNLVKGSTILFGGAPMDAIANLSAEYIANTSAQDLLANEIKDLSPTIANSFKQKYPFRVLLNITGKLSKPKIDFDIQTPKESNQMNSELKSAIENKLMQLRQDPASTNKQVFSLLLLNRFLGEQSADFFKSYTSDFSDIARKSVSRFVSSALNELAGDLLKGIDVDLNLNSYNDFTKGSGEQRTDLNVAISKSFFNDRLTLSVGSNFGLISNDNNSTDNNAVFRPDVTISYKLSKDGKYLIRAYTKNQFEVVLDGYVIENGLSFMITTDYDKFNELFNKRNKH